MMIIEVLDGYVSSNPPSESTKNLLLDLIRTEPAFFFSADDDLRLYIFKYHHVVASLLWSP
jgi:hypothetical protein